MLERSSTLVENTAIRAQQTVPLSEVGLRAINFGNKDDVQRMREIAADPHVQRYLGIHNDPETLFELSKMGLATTFAVTEKGGRNPDAEQNALQGWVYFCVDRSEETQQYRGNENKVDAYTVSYAKYPKARSGQMAQAVRAGCMAMFAKDALKANPNPDILAYADTSNTASWHVLEAAGFKRVAELTKAADEDNPTERQLYAYKLDWQALNDIVQKKDNVRLFTPIDPTELALAA